MTSTDGPDGLSRRRVLAGGAVVVGAWLVGTTRGTVAATTLVRSVQRRAVHLRERGGAAWAWHLDLHGSATSPVTLTVGGTAYDVETDGRAFSAAVTLREGENLVVAAAGGETATATYDVELAPRPIASAQARVAGTELVLDASGTQPGVTGAPVLSWRWTQRGGDDLVGLPATGEVVRVARPTGPGPWYVDLRAADRTGVTDRAGLTLAGSPVGATPAPPDIGAAWARDAVIYGVIPFAFGSRGFADVRAALGRLQDLGVTTLWLSPVFETLRYEFGYAVTDYFTIRADYGGREELVRLIDAAHERGLRVLLDIAANHTSDRHRYFRDAERHGERSHQYAYYDRDRDGEPTHYFDWEDLPNLGYDNPEVRTWMSEVFTHWVRELDVDGYRFDAAWGIRERRPDAWPELLAAMRRTKPDVLLLAEASSRDPYYVQTGFDLAYDWTDELGQWAWHDVFTDPDRLVERLGAAIDAAPGDRVFRFLNNNDTGERFLDRYGMGLTRAAVALLLTLPGVPCVYCGEEVGASLDPYEAYWPLDWTTHPELTEWYAALIGLRGELTALTTTPFERLPVTPAAEVFAYARGEVQVVINFSEIAVRAEVTTPSPRALVDRLSGETFAPGPLPLSPYGVRVLTPLEKV